MTRFLCVGDLHLDKGGRYGRVPGERLAEQEAVWGCCLELAREHQVDAVLFAGDAFEKRHPSTDAMLAFERPLVAHAREGGPLVIAISGNHDRSGVADFCALDVFAEAGLIELYSRPGVTEAAGVSIALLPWAPVSRIVAAQDGGDRDDVNAAAADLLLRTARELRASVEGPCVLVTHFSISGAVTPDGADVGLFREPVLPLADLEAVGFDAIVAGHIHRAQTLDVPTGFYVGSPLALDFGEAKCEHGVWILTVDEDPLAEFLPIESRSFLTLDIDATEGVSGQVAAESGGPIDGAFVKARLRMTEEQARRFNLEATRDGLYEQGAHNVWIETTVEREVRARVQGLDETISDTDMFESWLSAMSVNGDLAPALREKHGAYLEEIAR